MNTKPIWVLTFAMASACAHYQETSQSCPVCPVSSTARESQLEQQLDIERKNRGDYVELNEMHHRSVAYVDRWKKSFLKISTMFVDTFSSDSDEGDDPVADSNPNEDIRYTIEFIGGVMHISFPDEQLFARGESTLTPKGRSIVLRVAEVLASADQRHVTIACRTTVRSEGKNRTQWLTVRELSSQRAVAIMQVMEKNGINPRSLAAASLSNYSREDAMERATTTFIIYPSPREAPVYPNRVK